MGANADVAVCTGTLGVHKLECLTCEGGLAGLSKGHTEHKAEELCCLLCLFLVLAVDTHVSELKAEHLLYCISGECGNLVPLLLLDKVVSNHEGAAAGNDLVKLKVVKKVVRIDTAGRHKGKLTVGSSHSLKHLKTACSLGREELNGGETELKSSLYVGGISTAGKHGHTLGKSVGGNLGVKTGGNEELGACRDSRVNLLGGENGACTYKHLGECIRNSLDSISSTGGSEGDFCCGKTTVNKCLCKRNCILCVVDFNNRDKTYGIKLLNHIAHFIISFNCNISSH